MTIGWTRPLDADATVDSLIIGESAQILELRRLIRQVAPSGASVLITGASGSGKEMVARAIHVESRRGKGPFIAVNCGAIPRDLLESELFGHEKGSFTGALTQRRGRFEDAHNGSLFLDEIGDMPPDMQVKLLRVLEERAIERVGGGKRIAIDTRIISATHRDIEGAIADQRFREDLFYRLAVFPLRLPPLAARPDDVPLLVQHFLAQIADRQSTVKFTSQAMIRLVTYEWPGNVRELRNVVERAAILHPGETIGAEDVEALLYRGARNPAAERAALWAITSPAEMAEPTVPVMAAAAPAAAPSPLADGMVDLRALVSDLERAHIVEALRLCDNIVADAARMLTLQRTTLIEKMRKYGIERV